MEKAIQEKILTNQLVELLKKQDFDPFERALMIHELINLKRSNCKKCKVKVKKNNGMPPKGKERGYWCPTCAKVVDVLATEIGVGRKELYRIRKLIEVPKDIKKLVDDGKISADKVSRIIYNLKGKEKDKLKKIVNDAIKNESSVKEIEEDITEINEPKMVKTHAKNHLWRASQELKKAYVKLNAKDLKDVEVKDLINLCEEQMKKISNKK